MTLMLLMDIIYYLKSHTVSLNESSSAHLLFATSRRNPSIHFHCRFVENFFTLKPKNTLWFQSYPPKKEEGNI